MKIKYQAYRDVPGTMNSTNIERTAYNNLDYDYFDGDQAKKPWNLASKEDTDFLVANRKLPVHISDIAIVQNGVATNKDSVYVINAFVDADLNVPYIGKHSDKTRIVYFEQDGTTYPIESTILHRCVKGSTCNGYIGNTYIIFQK
jgi:hypothetical protein